MKDTKLRCGYLWASTDWIYGLFNKVDPLTSSCVLHDNLYENPGNLNRYQVDQLFLQHMLKTASHKNSSLLKAQAYLYYGIVRAVGWLVF